MMGSDDEGTGATSRRIIDPWRVQRWGRAVPWTSLSKVTFWELEMHRVLGDQGTLR
jgi:hypothetical protein